MTNGSLLVVYALVLFGSLALAVAIGLVLARRARGGTLQPAFPPGATTTPLPPLGGSASLETPRQHRPAPPPEPAVQMTSEPQAAPPPAQPVAPPPPPALPPVSRAAADAVTAPAPPKPTVGQLVQTIAVPSVPPPATPAPPAPSKGRRLVWLSGPREGRSDELPEAGLWIGREAPAQLILANSAVSRQHLWLGVEQGEVVLVDDRSSNGTYIGSERIKRRVLQPGEVVSVAYNVATFRLEQAGEA